MGNKSSLMLQDEEIKQISEETGFSPTQIEKLYSRFAHLDRSNCGTLSKSDLISIPELAINPLCDRLIQLFFAECDPEDERINFRQFMKVLATFRSSNTCLHAMHANNDKQSTQDEHFRESHLFKPGSSSTNKNNSNSKVGNSNTDINYRNSLDKILDPGKSNINDSVRKRLLFIFRIYDADNDGRISFNDLRGILKMMVGNYIEEVQLDKIATRALIEIDSDSDGFIGFNEFCKVFSGKDFDDKLQVRFFD